MDIEAGVANSSDHKCTSEKYRSGVTDLIGYRQNDSGKEELQQCAGILVGEAEKCHDQADKAENRNNIKNSDHLISNDKPVTGRTVRELITVRSCRLVSHDFRVVAFILSLHVCGDACHGSFSF